MAWLQSCLFGDVFLSLYRLLWRYSCCRVLSCLRWRISISAASLELLESCLFGDVSLTLCQLLWHNSYCRVLSCPVCFGDVSSYPYFFSVTRAAESCPVFGDAPLYLYLSIDFFSVTRAAELWPVFGDASPALSLSTDLFGVIRAAESCPVFDDVCPFSGHRDKSTSPAHAVTTVSGVGSSGDKQAVLKQIDECSSVYTRLGQRALDPARNRHFGDAAQIFRCKIFAQGPEDLFPFILSVARRKQRAGGLFIQGCSAEREATGITARQGEGDETGSANSPRSSPPPSASQCEPAGDDLDHSVSLSACPSAALPSAHWARKSQCSTRCWWRHCACQDQRTNRWLVPIFI